VASVDSLLLITLIFYAIIVVGFAYILFRIYRQRNRKITKLR
jgi:hypothetical protein